MDQSALDDSSKRQHIDASQHSVGSGLSPDEVEVHNQLQAHIASAASVYRQQQDLHLQQQQQQHQNAQQQQQQQQQHNIPQQHLFQDDDENALQDDDDDENDPDFEVDEEDVDQDQRDQEQLNAMMAAQAAHPWMNFMDPNAYALWDANQNLRIHSLPILDNLVRRSCRFWRPC